MHIRGYTPILAFLPLAWTAQVAFKQDVTVLSTSIIDVLSGDSDYTSLLGLLQRAKLIPTLNKLNGTTLFAPTNDAIKQHAQSNPLWQFALADNAAELRDNIQEKLRQELLYHMLNHTLEELPKEQHTETLWTLHYPRIPLEPPSHEPPPYPPWLPIPGGTLGGKPQRLRISSRDSTPFVGVNAFGENGVQVSKGVVNASNGVVIGIDEVLSVPPDLATVISTHPALSYWQNILTTELVQFLNATSELTLFLPVDNAWEALPYYERLYLESKYATDDLTRIVNMHAVASKKVHYSQSFRDGLSLTTVEGQKLKVTHSEGGKQTNISSAGLIESDIYASNGVIHTVDSLLVPPGTLQLTPEKYLLVLNCTSFVSLLHSVNLTSLINDTETHWTILAPRDDIISLGNSELPAPGSEELRKLLQYHFIPGKQSPKKLKHRMLLETALEEDGLGGHRQVLAVDVHEDDPKDKNKGKTRSIGFGGAGTIGDPVEVNNTLIYFISHPLTPPADVLTTALPDLDLSSFLAAIFSTGLADILKVTPQLTFLIPHNSAFKRLGLLVSNHLLSASSKSDLERVILHHTLLGVRYADLLTSTSQRTFPTLEGSDIQLHNASAPGNSSIVLTASGGWADMRSELYIKDTLTQTGVIHEVSDIMIPRSVDLTIGKLMVAAKASTMISMMNKAGLDWILNGTSPPEDTPWARLGLTGIGWTLLCPTDDAFKGFNLTELYADSERLRDIVLQHLVPTQQPTQAPPSHDFFDMLNNNRPLVLDDSTTYTTLLSGFSQSLFADVVFRDISGEGTVVGVKGARGQDGKDDWAHVLNWGRSTTGGGTGGVIQIDHLLLPYRPSAWVQYGAPIAVGVIGMFLICTFFYGVRAIWRRDTTEATYEPIGGFGTEDDDS